MMGEGGDHAPITEILNSLPGLQVPPTPSFERTERTIERVKDRFGTPAHPVERDPERLLQEMRTRIDGWNWKKVPMSFVARVARLVFASPWRERSDCASIRTFLIDEVAVSTRSGFLNPLVQLHIENFDARSPECARLAEALDRAKDRLGSQWRQLLGEVPEFFDPAKAPQALARRMAGMEDLWTGLRRLGLRAPHDPGLMDAAHLEFLTLIGSKLADRSEIERLLAWLRPAGQKARASGAAEAISALLWPWQGRSPPKDIQSLLVDRVTEFYGHPKVSRNAVWNLVEPRLEQLMLRWLVGRDIRFLFHVLTDVERGHMWPDREEFWWREYEKGRVDEVWIAFNEAGYRAAMARLPPEARQTSPRFAHQTGESDKSLLIMRIRDKIAVEGTFNFKVHIFDAADRSAPKLYQQRYDVADIRNLSSALTRAHLGDWQSWVLRNI